MAGIVVTGGANGYVDPIDIPPAVRCTTLWSVANTSEAFPGTLTPLGWTFVGEAMEIGSRQALIDIGAITKRELHPTGYDDRISGIFLGRASMNIDFNRAVADRVPGSSGDQLEQALTGGLRAGVTSEKTIRRYPVILTRLPWLLRSVPKRAKELRHETDEWWRRSIKRLDTASEAQLRALVGEGMERFERILRRNSTAGFLGGNVFGVAYQLCGKADRMDLAPSVIAGFGRVEETDVAEDLRRVAVGTMTMDAFLDVHGYHGTGEGEIRSTTWREDAAPIQRLLEQYAALPADQTPARRVEAQHAEHQRAIRELRTALPRHRRWQVSLYDRLAEAWVPLREVTKAAYLQCIDVARGAALRLGATMAADGRLEDPADVFFVTADELVAGRTPSHDEIRFRKERWDAHHGVGVPDNWTGRPEPIVDTDDTTYTDTLQAMGASPGVAEGTARVVRDPANDDIEPGQILVCSVTDPSWVSLIAVCAGIVADIGGPLSHAAIVARELGVPCVIATKNGTTVIGDGDHVRIDGSTGTVEILRRAARATG